MSETKTEVPKPPMSAGDYVLACCIALSSKHPLANLRVVVNHFWEDLTSGWFTSAAQSQPEQIVLPPAKFNPAPKTSILYARRFGVYVAYIPEDLMDQDGEVLKLEPRIGMALFAEVGSHVTVKTGDRKMLDELARLTGRKLELMPEHAFFIPFTSSSSDDDAERFGHLILTRDQAFRRWYVLGQWESATG